MRPLILFIHGFGSCGWGEKSLRLRRHFGVERLLAPDLPFHPQARPALRQQARRPGARGEDQCVGVHLAFVVEMQEHARFPDAVLNTIDGVRADYEDGWGLVRASNTTPILVVRFEADDEAALKRIQGAFKQQMLAINGDLKLPF